MTIAADILIAVRASTGSGWNRPYIDPASGKPWSAEYETNRQILSGLGARYTGVARTAARAAIRDAFRRDRLEVLRGAAQPRELSRQSRRLWHLHQLRVNGRAVPGARDITIQEGARP